MQRMRSEDGEVYRTVSWMAPEDLVQCSFTGEWVGLVLAIRHHEVGTLRIKVKADSAALKVGWGRVSWNQGVNFTGTWDGLHRQSVERCEQVGIKEAIVEQEKAHRKEAAGISEEDKVDIRGNGAADFAANSYMPRH